MFPSHDMGAQAFNNHLPLIKDPFLTTVGGATHIYGNKVLGQGDEFENLVAGGADEIINTDNGSMGYFAGTWSANPSSQLPWRV